MQDFDYKHIPAKKQAEIFCKAREAAENSAKMLSLEQVSEKFGYKGDEAKLFLLTYNDINRQKVVTAERKKEIEAMAQSDFIDDYKIGQVKLQDIREIEIWGLNDEELKIYVDAYNSHVNQ